MPQYSAPISGNGARVQDVVYYGHDASVRLRLIGDGRSDRLSEGEAAREKLTARVAGYQCPHISDEMVIVVEGKVVTYRVGNGGAKAPITKPGSAPRHSPR